MLWIQINTARIFPFSFPILPTRLCPPYCLLLSLVLFVIMFFSLLCLCSGLSYYHINRNQSLWFPDQTYRCRDVGIMPLTTVYSVLPKQHCVWLMGHHGYTIGNCEYPSHPHSQMQFHPEHICFFNHKNIKCSLVLYGTTDFQLTKNITAWKNAFLSVFEK